jgi:hypothetical protein
LWRPDSGDVAAASYSRDGNRTIVPVNLDPHETLFVVFRGDATVPSREVPDPQLTQMAEVSGEWTVTFPPALGAPDRIQVSRLDSWTEHESPGVRYFSGTATYSTDFDAPDAWFQPGRRLLVSLGDVRDVAEVFVNSWPLGTLWKPPYRVDATHALRAGENHLEIRITNQWTNRILGDRLAPTKERVMTATPATFGRGRREPDVAGLLGPVRILAVD